MNRIDSVEITGFWGARNLCIPFHSDVSFLIGVNGSGKTTVINMIAAALTVDFAALDRLVFNTIKIDLSEVGGRKKPTIIVEKVPNEDSPYQSITYKIKEKASDKFKEYSLDEFEEERLLRRGMHSHRMQVYMRQMNRGIFARIESLVNVSWLSIHRAELSDRGSDERNHESLVDRKLDQLNMSLMKYFSSLSKKVTDEIEDFQKSIILSLLTEQNEKSILTSVQSFDLETEKSSLIEIFNKLGIKQSKASTKIEKHFSSVKNARDKLVEKDQTLLLSDLMPILSSFRIHRVVQEWNVLLDKQKEVMVPQDTFIDVLNGLFQKKKLSVNDNNEIFVTTESGRQFPVKQLSSGEKQLFIILGEALLQKNAAWVYIADEPELSLHVSWQETLIENLRMINPMAQIICATHSPDVVSVFEEKVFNMEDVIV